MKLFYKILILTGIVAIVFFSQAAYANHKKSMTRADFVKLIVSGKFSQAEIEACDKNNLPFSDVRLRHRTASYICMAYKNKFIKRNSKFRPAAPITLAEAAAILKNAFDLPVAWPNYSDRSPWYQPYLLALEERSAIPISFWTPSDIVTKEEAMEMIFRLEQKDITKPSMTFEALQAQKNRYRAKDFIRIHGDFTQSIGGKIITPGILKLFQEPATYYIDDIAASEQNDQNYCHNFYTQSGVQGNVAVVTKGDDATITIEALSSDYCVFPFTDMQPGECPPDAIYADDPRCNRGQAKPYILTLEKKGDKLFIKGAESNRIRITRAPIERLCREFADGCPAGYYDYTKVETNGTLSDITTPKGEIWDVYKTKWRPIFADLRGVPFMFFQKTLDDGSRFQKYYEAPEHNRNAWGHGFASYEDCISSVHDFQFCIKRAGDELVIVSPYELGDRLTIWIDTNYRR